MTRALIILAAALLAGSQAHAQTTTPKTPAKKPATTTAKAAEKPAAPQRIAAPATVTCPHVLGPGMASKLEFCDVLTGRSPAEGIVIRLPPHKDVLTLSFDLHNRHTYSEDLIKAGKGYVNYTATIGVLAMDGTLLGRGVVRSEFRTAKDLFDRIGGGAGPKGMKAVAPVGIERITIDVPADVSEVSVLGEKLTVINSSGTETFTSAQRPIADVSNVNIEYQPVPKAPAKPAAKTPVKKKK
jgi:hypothetical protein